MSSFKTFLLNILRTKTAKGVLACLAAAVTAYAASGCGLLGSTPRAPQVDVFECQLEVLVEAVPKAAAEDLVMAARAGQIQYLVRQLLRLGVSPARIDELATAFGACEALDPPPAPSAPAPAQPMSIEAN